MTLVEMARDVLAKFRGRRVGDVRVYAGHLRGRRGLEIGGSSRIFTSRGAVPVYREVESLDNCLFARDTVWSGPVEESGPYRYHPRKTPGRQFVLDMTDLAGIGDASYDFLLASHVIEHIANPLRALDEAARVLRPKGVLLMVVPHRDATFDHERPLTTLQHLVDDHRLGVGEDDMTHLPEILARHDLAIDTDAGDVDAFRRRSLDNQRNRCLHQHVFDTELVVRMLDHAGWELLAVDPVLSCHIVTLARRPGDSHPDNRAFLAADASWRQRSPFRSDRTDN